MSLAPQELENSASKYAAEAIKQDSQGSRGMAIQSYQRAIEALVKLVQIYPDYKLNKVYMERATAYQNRIKALQMSHGLEEERASPQIDSAPQGKILQMVMASLRLQEPPSPAEMWRPSKQTLTILS